MEDKARKLKVGELLVSEGCITSKQLQAALAEQMKDDYAPLGEVCVRLKFISKPELQQVLKKHKKRIYLGELLMNMGLISQEELDQVLEVQAIEGKRLGNILIEHGYINESMLINSLSTQLGIPKIIPTAGLVDPSVLKGISKAFLQKNECLPVFRDGDTITVVMSDPLSEENIRAMENIFKCKIEPAIASSDEIQKGIKLVYDDLRLVGGAADDKSARHHRSHLVIGDSVASERGEENVVEVANFIISNAIAEGATDIHIEPMENMLRVRYRVDGILQHKTDLPLFMATALCSRIKALCGLDIADKRRHQDGRLGARVMNKSFDLRVSTYSAKNGESISIRVLPNQSNMMELDMLGLSPATLRQFKNLLEAPSGILMVTGPSGCGKTTTVYSSLMHLNNLNKKIITVEDPIEYTVDGVIQGQISERSGLTYENSVRSMLRQDPDVIMIGEVRDKASALAVVETSLSGHKVLTTFHTDDTVGALLRLFEIGIETFLISSTVLSVMSQRLVRTLCPLCKVPYVPGDDILASFGSIRPINVNSHTFYAPGGCLECDNTGFKGRTSVNELLLANNAVRDALLNRLPSSKIRAVARQSTRLVSMQEDGFYKATKGITSLEEVLRLVRLNESDAQTPRSADELVALCEMGEGSMTLQRSSSRRSSSYQRPSSDRL
ncbi:MAG TPA: ATPase, T2SS/T4P/T4SS family [Thermodesulfovibrionales bacterium]|nr:ATPase, T2SS/T4P/T4SS family [Thermodesulfovibrionales bacterium]